jgi:hypothetical protein
MDYFLLKFIFCNCCWTRLNDLETLAHPIKRIRYNDRKIRIIAIIIASYIVTEYGGNSPLLPRLLTLMYYIEFGATLIITTILVETIYRITRFLDIRYPWDESLLIRILLQFLLGVACPTVASYLLAALYFGVQGYDIIDYNFHIYALPFIALLITLFNVYYFVRYLLAERAYYKRLDPIQEGIEERTAPLRLSDEHRATVVFMVHTVNKSFPIEVNEIAYFFREANHVFLRPFDGEDHLLNQSLDQIEKDLNNRDFFRVARHMLISHNSLKDYRPLNFGKLAVTLNPPYREAVTASKPLSRSFRQWVANPGGL